MLPTVVAVDPSSNQTPIAAPTRKKPMMIAMAGSDKNPKAPVIARCKPNHEVGLRSQASAAGDSTSGM
jgi:hypothetical protein